MLLRGCDIFPSSGITHIPIRDTTELVPTSRLWLLTAFELALFDFIIIGNALTNSAVLAVVSTPSMAIVLWADTVGRRADFDVIDLSVCSLCHL